jgi:ribonuclease HI
MHDTEAALNHGLAGSSLTFDIAGFFNNVSHPTLLSTLRKRKIPLPLVKWVQSFLTDRKTAMCLDGIRDEMKETTTGIPQGSCVSPILAAFLTAPLSKIIHEALQPGNLNDETNEKIAADEATRISLILYVDDGKIHVASKDILTNVILLRTAFLAVEKWMTDRGMKLDIDKSEAIHHSRRRCDKNTILTPISLPRQGDRDETTIIVTPSIKWLGIIFDKSLNFVQHLKDVAMKAQKAVDSLTMLGNSTRGLDQYYRRLLYLGAILPMMTYGSTTWWNGTKQQQKIVSKVQNAALRQITGAFRTTPILAMEVTSSVPPIQIHLDYLTDRAAKRLMRLNARHPVVQRLPKNLREQALGTQPEAEYERPPFATPHKNRRQTTQTARSRARKEHDAKCTRLWKAGNRMITDAERIDPIADPPWHRSEVHEPAMRVVVRVPPTFTDGESQKEPWAKRHKAQAKRRESNKDTIAIYTDGSLSFVGGIRKTGYGVAAYQTGEQVFTARGPLGERVEGYNAEMEALCRGAEEVEARLRGQNDGTTRTILFYSDNTGAIQRIYKGTPGNSKECSRRFRDSIHNLLDTNPLLRVIIEWVPGHHEIVGNDAADKLAKDGSHDIPTSRMTQSACFAANVRKRELRERWIVDWADQSYRASRGQFAAANIVEPSLAPTKRMREVKRKTFSRIIQCTTGHTHLGSYYTKFVPSEDPECPCGAILQTREHILLDCERYEQHRHLLFDDEDIISTESIFGSDKGMGRLAAFIEASNAFSKPPEGEPA